MLHTAEEPNSRQTGIAIRILDADKQYPRDTRVFTEVDKDSKSVENGLYLLWTPVYHGQ